MRVTFFHADAARFAPPRELDPDREPHLFERGEQVWTVQTCARLARKGLPVTLSATAPRDGLVVFHVKERRALLHALPPRADVLLVGVRADFHASGVADIEIVQNGRFADGVRRHFIPSWPQPGLIPRRTERGTAVRRATFKGFNRNIHPGLLSASWRDFLAALGVEWEVDAIHFDRHGSGNRPLQWHDYSEVDLVVALRPDDRRLHTPKPASKLYNAWHAGVPAVLGREFAYRELRRSPLDYLEVANMEQAKAAVTRLVGDPELYRRMVEHGRRRAEEFGVEQVAEQWRTLLFSVLPDFAASRRGRALRRVPVRLRAASRAVATALTLRPTR